MNQEPIRLFRTQPHPCGYYAGRTAQSLVLDPTDPYLPRLYAQALTYGFRRAGNHVYHPQCPQCRACQPARIAVRDFAPDRNQRRCLKRNADLAMHVAPARYSRECFDLYRRYLDQRHAGGGMDHPEPQDFAQFLYTEWSPTSFLEFRDGTGTLLGVAVTDAAATGLSAVYTFYDPDEEKRSLGTYAILRQIELARERGLPHVYLGYWLDRHPKMDYKARFRPLEIRSDDGWTRMPLP